jgi:hypothetical protein
MCTPNNPTPPYKPLYKADPHHVKNLNCFGELVATSNSTSAMKVKSRNRRLLAIYVGQALDHSSDTYRLFNIKTHKVLLSSNVKFLGIMHDEYFNRNNNNPYYWASDKETRKSITDFSLFLQALQFYDDHSLRRQCHFHFRS